MSILSEFIKETGIIKPLPVRLLLPSLLFKLFVLIYFHLKNRYDVSKINTRKKLLGLTKTARSFFSSPFQNFQLVIAKSDGVALSLGTCSNFVAIPKSFLAQHAVRSLKGSETLTKDQFGDSGCFFVCHIDLDFRKLDEHKS